MSKFTGDAFRQAVYAAEDQWSAAIDRGGSVDFFGSQVVVPVQLRFGSLRDVRKYVQETLEAMKVPTAQVRHRKGGSRAHYEQQGGIGVIAVPSDQVWAMREAVILHEIAHHVCATRSGSLQHDRTFTSTMLDLVDQRLGPEAALLLRTGYQAGGVPV